MTSSSNCRRTSLKKLEYIGPFKWCSKKGLYRHYL